MFCVLLQINIQFQRYESQTHLHIRLFVAQTWCWNVGFFSFYFTNITDIIIIRIAITLEWMNEKCFNAIIVFVFYYGLYNLIPFYTTVNLYRLRLQTNKQKQINNCCNNNVWYMMIPWETLLPIEKKSWTMNNKWMGKSIYARQ